MAFVASNVKTVGHGGGLKSTVGTFTALQGDAAGSLTVPGGTVWSADFVNNDTGQPLHGSDWKAAAGSVANTSTLTIYLSQAVTNGRFIVWHS